MIPKIIHYCWFGGKEKPKLVKKCIKSWEKYCPDFQIIEWNENNFDIYFNTYTRFTSERKLYAYLSDYVRLYAVYKNGGIYLDTDIEIIRPLDSLLDNKCFFGFELSGYVTTGLGFGAEVNNKIVEELLNEYNALKEEELLSRYAKDKRLTGSPTMNMKVFKRHGLLEENCLQKIDEVMIYPSEYFCPFDDVTGEMSITENTYSIHWYGKSALGTKSRIRSHITRPLHRIINKIRREHD